MPNAFIPPWSPWYASRPRPGAPNIPNPEMRVSDAERSEIADALSKHYAEGRLDETEFNERLHKAMAAKTRGDLGGLLVDLPAVPPPPPPNPQVHRHGGRLAFFLIMLVLFASAVGSTMWTWHFPWILFVIIGLFAWRRSRFGWHRHRHMHPPSGVGPGPYYGNPNQGSGWGHAGPGWWA